MAGKWVSSGSLANVWVIPAAVAAAAYNGPGDIVTGAKGWWGLRAYSNAMIGTNAIRLRRDSDNAESDFVTLTDGSLDVASISAWAGAANLFVVTLYDQTGTGNDLTQAVAASQPAFSLSGGPSSLPMLFLDSSVPTRMQLASFSETITQPYSISSVAQNNGRGTRGDLFRGDAIIGYEFAGAANTFWFYAGVVQSVAANEDAYHAIQTVFDGAVAACMVDGSDSTGLNAGVAQFVAAGGTPVCLGALVGEPASACNANFEELGLWELALDATQRGDLDSNQRAYWGF